MHFGRPVIAYDCEFNRCTTENQALFFKTPDNIISLLASMNESTSKSVGGAMLEIAQRRYTWDVVAKQYFDLLTA
ncbi:GT4_PimA-like domain containing protein [Methylophilaceae bacterium]